MTPKPLNEIEEFCLQLFDLIGANHNVARACVNSVMLELVLVWIVMESV